jgi:hypothetical protein
MTQVGIRGSRRERAPVRQNLDVDDMAWDDAGTRRAYWRFVMRSGALLVGGLVLAVGSILVLTDGTGESRAGVPDVLVIGLVGIGLTGVILGPIYLVVAVRIWRVLRRYPWIEMPSRSKWVWSGRARLAVLTLGKHADLRLNLTAPRLRWGALTGESRMLVCLPAKGGAVVATTDHRALAWGSGVVRPTKQRRRN